MWIVIPYVVQSRSVGGYNQYFFFLLHLVHAGNFQKGLTHYAIFVQNPVQTERNLPQNGWEMRLTLQPQGGNVPRQAQAGEQPLCCEASAVLLLLHLCFSPIFSIEHTPKHIKLPSPLRESVLLFIYNFIWKTGYKRVGLQMTTRGKTVN